jgi:predicted O-methyltransferase YrrM
MEIDELMKYLTGWVMEHGTGWFIYDSFMPSKAMEDYSIPEDFGMQQVFDEIREFAELLISKKEKTNILEIGLGYFGSTHFLWRALFDKVITIEINNDRVREFGVNLRKYYQDASWTLNDNKSSFIIGSSNDPQVIKKVYDFSRKIGRMDVLFIDGDHSYAGVLSDWLIYALLVKKGGIVAFHDCQCAAADFIYDLENGNIDGEKHIIHRIVHSKAIGIGYYIKE